MYKSIEKTYKYDAESTSQNKYILKTEIHSNNKINKRVLKK